MPAEVVAVGCGMMTPVGLSSLEVAASARSRVQRLGEIDIFDRRLFRFVVGAVPDDGLPDLDPLDALLTRRAGRMIQLAGPALKEALQALPEKIGKIPLLLGLPEIQTKIAIDGADLIARLARDAPIDPDASEVFADGRASALIALEAGAARLAKGKVPFCLVGGLDCQFDPYILSILDLQGRVRHAANPDGFAPSEGAGFLLLTTADHARQHRLKPSARVVACASGFEKGHIYSDEPYRGDGLAETFTALFKDADGLPPIGCVYASFNGERYWSKEFGVAMLRNRDRFDTAHQMEHPAECFGDLGAAHGAALAGLACLGLTGGYRRGPCLVYSSSDFGKRAAALIDAPKSEAGNHPRARGA